MSSTYCKSFNDQLTSWGAALSAKRVRESSVFDKSDWCRVCKELLHPFPEPSYWMQYPLPTCILIDGNPVCDDSRRPSCVKKYLKQNPTPLYRSEDPHPFTRNMEGLDVMSEAQRVRAGADEELLKEKLADWPPSSATGYRDNDSVNWQSPFMKRKQPEDPVKLRAKLEEFLKSARASLASDCARYDAIRNAGLSEISDYDVSLAGWQDCPPTMQAWRAINSALRLKHNHTTYQRSLVRSLMDKLDTLNEELGMAGRIDVPAGFEVLEIELPPHQVFIARKWQASALSKVGKKAENIDLPGSRVRVLLPAHQAFQVKQWASQAHAKRMASNSDISPAELRLVEGGEMEDGRELVEVQLDPIRDSDNTWVTGWRVRVRDTVDHYTPLASQPPYYELYRPPSTRSDDYRISCAEGAFGASVVLEQLKETFAQGGDEARAVAKLQERIRRRARDWNQLLLDLGDFIPFPKQRCVVSKSRRSYAKDEMERVVIVTQVCRQTRTVFAYEDKPMRYRLNGRGREVVEFDPKSIQTVYSWNELRPHTE